MDRRFGRRGRSLRGWIATSLLAVCARAEGAPQLQPAQPYVPPTTAPQTYTAAPPTYPPPSAQPFAYSYAPSAYAAAYSQPVGAGVSPDRGRVDLSPGEHRFSLLVSVVHPLAFSIYDASGEFRLGRRAGLAVVAGLGSTSLKQFYKSLPDERARVWEGGLQARFYPVGTFDHGLQVGGEIVYLTGSASITGTITSPDDPSESYTGPITAKGSGFKVGPFVGYKLALPVGLTLGAQVGVDYLALKGIAKAETGNTRTGDTKTALLLVDAGVGWSF